MLISIINLIFSPFCLLFFILFAANKGETYFIPTNTNVNKLKPLPYIIFCAIYVTVILTGMYLLSLYSSETFNVWEVFVPKFYWVSVPIWIITGLTLFTYFKGMEGNIMGFIFFPLLALASLVMIGINVLDLLFFNWDLNIHTPIFELNIWLRLALHAFLPAYVLLAINTREITNSDGNDWILTIVSNIVLQIILFGTHWGIFKLFDRSLSFSHFFGESQTIFYYLPMFFGFLYFTFFYLSQNKTLQESIVFEKLVYTLALVTKLMIILQIVNYLSFIKSYF